MTYDLQVLERFKPTLYVLLSGLLMSCGSTPEFVASVEEPPSQIPRYSLAELPAAETFNELSFSGSPVGFTYVTVRPGEEGRYEIRSQAFMDLNLIATERVTVANSVNIVDERLRIKSFDYRYWVDGVESRLVGTIDGLTLNAQVVRNGRVDTRSVTLKRPPLPSAALALYPALNGLEVGRQYNFSFLEGETLGVKVVQQEVQAYETSEEVGVSAYKIFSNVQGQAVRTWMSAQAEPLFEASMGGIVTAKSLETTAATQQVMQAVFDERLSHQALGRVSTDGTIANPGSVLSVRVALDGIGHYQDVPSHLFQYCEPEPPALVCETSTPVLGTQISGMNFDDTDAYLVASKSVPSDDQRVAEVARELIGSSTQSIDVMRAIVKWMERRIRLKAGGAAHVVEALDTGNAGARAQSLVYAALARYLGVPTRVVNGIAYSPERASFVYRTWAESFADGIWYRVDPTEQQLPADGTHIALNEGDGIESAVRLMSLLGRLGVKVLDVHSAPAG